MRKGRAGGGGRENVDLLPVVVGGPYYGMDEDGAESLRGGIDLIMEDRLLLLSNKYLNIWEK